MRLGKMLAWSVLAALSVAVAKMLVSKPTVSVRIRASLITFLTSVLSRQSFVHALLALLLLLSQQIGTTHVYSHWVAASADSTARAQSLEDTGDKLRQLADTGCLDCLSIAQVTVAIGSPILTVAASPFSFGPIATPVTLYSCLRTVCVFQSRAPPQA